MLYCLIVAVLFCIGNLLNSRQRKSAFFDVVKEERSRTLKVYLLLLYLLVRQALRKTKSGKAPGMDEIPAELLKQAATQQYKN